MIAQSLDMDRLEFAIFPKPLSDAAYTQFTVLLPFGLHRHRSQPLFGDHLCIEFVGIEEIVYV